jgi:hypothetical protein
MICEPSGSFRIETPPGSTLIIGLLGRFPR